MKRTLLALAIGATVFGSIYGLADSLGVTSTSLGAGSATVAACQSSLSVSYLPSFSVSSPAGYRAANVVLNGLTTACANKNAVVTLSGPTTPVEVTVPIGAITVTTNVNVPFPGVLASEVTGVHVVITG